MAAKTQRSITIDAPPRRDLRCLIADFGAYPSWVRAAKSVEVLASGPDGRADKVRFVLGRREMVKDTYVPPLSLGAGRHGGELVPGVR